MKQRSLIGLSSLLFVVACSADDRSIFEPSLFLRLSLPAGFAPRSVSCLDIVLSSSQSEPPETSVGFGGNPLLLKVQSIDLDGDNRPELRIRFIEGSHPFSTQSVDFVLSAAAGARNRSATFTVTAIARKADGLIAADDACLGGTAIAQGSAQKTTSGAVIRFPDRGDDLALVQLQCVLATGCELAVDGGAPDGGTLADGGR